MREATPDSAFVPAARRPRPGRAFTLVEMTLVILITAIIATLGLDAVANFEAAQRADRACRESLTFFRFARSLACSTGKKAKVTVDTTHAIFAIYWQSNGSTYDTSPYATGIVAGGSWTLNINSSRELVGTSLSISPNTITYFEYNPLGNCSQTGTIAFSYAGKTKSLVIPAVGDPQVQ